MRGTPIRLAMGTAMAFSQHVASDCQNYGVVPSSLITCISITTPLAMHGVHITTAKAAEPNLECTWADLCTATCVA